MRQRVTRYARRLLNRYYTSAKLLYRIELNRDVSKLDGLILVYQMGKVGSSSVVKSIESKKIPVYNVHTFNPFFLDRTEDQFKKLWEPNGPLPRTLWDQQYFSGYVKKKKNSPFKIVTLVRDPVARNISHFFQYPNIILEKIDSGYHIRSLRYNYDKILISESIDKELSELFLKNMDNHFRPLVWFDEELKINFGIDVYSKEFPKERGYAIYRKSNAEVLLIKLEMLNEVFRPAMKEFLDIDDIELINENIGEKKESADMYKQFLSSFHLSEKYLGDLYNSKFSNHFYTKEELNRFEMRWRHLDPD